MTMTMDSNFASATSQQTKIQARSASECFPRTGNTASRVSYLCCLITFLCVSSTLPCEIASAAVHPNHVSLTEIEFNPKTGNLEVSLRVWPEDLEKVIAKLKGEPTKLDHKILKELMPGYLKEKFVVRPIQDSQLESDGPSKQEPLSIRWVGAEIEVATAWLYFEVQTSGSKPDWEIDNKIFCELNDDQLNYISARSRNLRSRDSIQRCQCTAKSEPNRISFPKHRDQ